MSIANGDNSSVLLIAGQDDGVAVRLGEALIAQGRRVAYLDGPAAARLFTLRSGALGTTVHPHLPIFVRPSAWWHVKADDSADARFLRAECYAMFWAAMALTDAPVINRPGRNGVLHRLTAAALAAIRPADDERISEIYASSPDRVDHPMSQFWGEDVQFRTGPLTAMRPNLPLRARAVEKDARYEIVTVVGHRAFPATTDLQSQRHALGPRSVALVKEAEVQFATVTWAMSGATATPVRLNAEPQASELRFVWADLVAALCEDLFG